MGLYEHVGNPLVFVHISWFCVLGDSIHSERLLKSLYSASVLMWVVHVLFLSVVNRRLDVVEFFYESPHVATTIRSILRACPDIERVLQKVLRIGIV